MNHPNYSKETPFFAKLKTRERLCHPISEKSTQHIVLDLSNSGIVYSVGDCIAICPSNSHEYVQSIIESLGHCPKTLVSDRKGEGPYSLQEFLTKEANLSQPTRALVELIHSITPSPLTEELIQEKEKMRLFLSENDVLDILLLSPTLPLLPFCHSLSPLHPRYYSISSSHLHVGDEVHLTVAPLKYELKEKVKRGVCSRYICEIFPETPIPIFIHPHRGFTLPQDQSLPIIMIGPGTGIAPFRAFMQERLSKQSTGKNWLFFGEWRKDYDFFYRDFWEKLVKEDKLRLTTAFSRDTEQKVYVQHKMREESSELFKWLQEGAYLYVCGDAQKMAKDVEQTLLEIIEEESGCSPQEALNYIKTLRKEKRYLRDVY